MLSSSPLPSAGQVDALRLRLEEKETTLNKKSKQIQEMSEEKGTLNGEIHDLKDMLEVKERKVNVLQKKVELDYISCCIMQKSYYVLFSKRFVYVFRIAHLILCVRVQIENLQEQLRDKEKQMSSLKERVKSLQTDTSNTDTALNTLEESLAEKVHTHTTSYIGQFYGAAPTTSIPIPT
jgi:ELKS/RAB6-interacting/CAST family protein 1